jgi:hypothetical protein
VISRSLTSNTITNSPPASSPAVVMKLSRPTTSTWSPAARHLARQKVTMPPRASKYSATWRRPRSRPPNSASGVITPNSTSSSISVRRGSGSCARSRSTACFTASRLVVGESGTDYGRRRWAGTQLYDGIGWGYTMV